MQKFFKLDWVILVTVALLVAIGFLALYSVSRGDLGIDLGNFRKQLISAVVGIVLMFGIAFFDYRALSFFSTKLYFATLAVLFLVLFLGTKIRGTTGWIGVGSFNIQPVEMAKLAMVVFLASFFSKKKSQLSIVVRITTSVILIFFPVYLIIKQPDFGSAMVIVVSWAALLSISGISKKNLLILFLIGSVISYSGWFLLRPYQKERLINFVNPYNDPRGSGYNVIQSMVAVGSGGLFGKGLGHGSQSQLNFLPEKHTDFIFAVIAEEMGFLGAAAVLFLLSLLLYRIKEVARSAGDNFGYLLAVGIMMMLFSQILVNVGMNIGVMPVAGVPLPFLSYGGSSLVAVFASIGIVQSIYIHKMKTL
ncbi:MAG: rod shape-determining protein RodA [Parcubacteria group bacterium]|jgi:rod shape determining protein RodA